MCSNPRWSSHYKHVNTWSLTHILIDSWIDSNDKCSPTKHKACYKPTIINDSTNKGERISTSSPSRLPDLFSSMAVRSKKASCWCHPSHLINTQPYAEPPWFKMAVLTALHVTEDFQWIKTKKKIRKHWEIRKSSWVAATDVIKRAWISFVEEINAEEKKNTTVTFLIVRHRF